MAIAVFALFLILCTAPSGAHVVGDDWIPVESLNDIKVSGSYYLTKDLNLTEIWIVPEGEDINLCLNGHVINQTAIGSSVIRISGSGTELTLYDCSDVIHHFDKTYGAYGDDLWVLNDANMSSPYFVTGGVITGSSTGGYYEESGVDVLSGGTFTMFGGNIVGNAAWQSGGVYNAGTFMMYDGKITGNYATHGGGVYNAGIFTMYGGDIVGNSAMYSGGVGVYDGTFTLIRGNIANNDAWYGGGVALYSGNFDMIDGIIEKNTAIYGGGVYAGYNLDLPTMSYGGGGNFTMLGGSIVDNIASYGGGVCAHYVDFVMSGGSISDNTANAGDGVYGSFTMQGDATVDGIYLTTSPIFIDAGNNGFTGGASNIVTDFHNAGDAVVEITDESSLSAGSILNQFSLADDWKTLIVSDDNKKLIVSIKYDPFDIKIPVDSLNDIKSTGSYYLTKDVILTDTWNVPSGKNISLCLNGFVIKQTGKEKSVIGIYGDGTRLHVYDNSDVKHYFDKDEETGLWVLNDANKGSPYNVTGGVITGGIITEYGNGGGVYNNGGCFTMSGGNIIGNTADEGGGVYNYEGTFTMSGGNIIGNTALGGGGVHNNGGCFTMSGGNIEDNTAKYSGGGVEIMCSYNSYEDCIFRMSGGNIIGNTADKGGGVYNYRGIFKMSGDATIDGIYLYKYSRNICIAGNEFTGSASDITKQDMIVGDTIVEIDEYSSLTASDILDKFSLTDKTLMLVAGDDGKQLIVAGDTQPTPTPIPTYTPTSRPTPTLTPIHTPTSTPVPTPTPTYTHTLSDVHPDYEDWIPVGSLYDITESGSYYLTNDVILTDTWIVPEGKNINLCLNGRVVKQTKYNSAIKISYAETQLNLYDCGNTIHHFDKNYDGLWVLNDANTGSPYNVIGGVITGIDGGVLVEDGTFIMHSGNIVGNNAYTGGGVCAKYNGTFTMFGGSIVGNSADQLGGGVCAEYGGTFIMSGGNIANNIANDGGGVHARKGNFTMSGGNIANNIANNGGGVYVNYYSNFTLSGGNIMYNIAKPQKGSMVSTGGGVYSKENFTMSGGNIEGNTVEKGSYGGVYNQGTFTLSGGNIEGNTASSSVGGVGNSGTFTMSGGNISSNSAENDCGGVDNSGTFMMSGGNITGNTAKMFDGGGVGNSGTFTMSGGNIADNTAREGGGVCNDDYSTFTMSGGNIEGNTASSYGGGVCNDYYSTFMMSGGNIEGNTAKYGDSVCNYYNHGTFTLNGDVTVDGVYLCYDDEYDESWSANINITCDEFNGAVSNIVKENLIVGDTIVEIDSSSSLTARDLLGKFRLADTSKSLIASEDNKKLIVAEAAQAPKFSGAALSLSTDIAVRFNVNDTALEGYSNPYIDVTFNGAEYKNIRAVHDAVAEKQRFTFRNISPAEMNDVIIAKLYATKDGESAPVLCDTREYSVKTYCDNMLNKESTHSLLKTLCVDLLNYGSASQVYTGETDASKFANYTLTPTQKSWASTTITPAVRNDQSISETGDDSVGVWRSASLNLYSDISLILKFTTDVDVSNLEAEIKYGVDLGETATVTGFTDSTYSGGDCKQIKFNKMNAQELNYPVEITLVDKTTGKRSKTLTYSVDAYSYSYSKIDGGGDLGALVTSIMKYIRSVDRIA